MGTWEADANFKTQLRQDVLNEMTGTVGQVFLGFTVGCARCHDHKYDPIPQRDFYRLQAFFAPMKMDNREAPFSDAEGGSKAMRDKLRTLEDQLRRGRRVAAQDGGRPAGAVSRQGQTLLTARRRQSGDKPKPRRLHGGAEESQGHLVHRASRRPRGERRPTMRARLASLWRVTVRWHIRYRTWCRRRFRIWRPPTFWRAATSSSRGERVEPGFLQAVVGSDKPAEIPFVGGSSGRRLALAEWIASPANPLTARVMVNRLWQHHFGEGIVRTPSDFGINGDRPSHPELLDYLATQFVEKKWSMKAMHRMMLLSNTYRQSTENPAQRSYAEADPKNLLLWRMNWIRLEGEEIRDSMLAISGQLQKSKRRPGSVREPAGGCRRGIRVLQVVPVGREAAGAADYLYLPAPLGDESDDRSVRWRQHERGLFAPQRHGGADAGLLAVEQRLHP